VPELPPLSGLCTVDLEMANGEGSLLDRAAEFLLTHARLLERRLFELSFQNGDPDAALRAVLSYQNPDGGFGHAMEPDLRASSSQPVFVHFALSALREAGLPGPPLGGRMCAFLGSVSTADGALPYILPDALEHPRADHWQGDYGLTPSLHATAGVTAGLHALGVRHEWLDRATEWCLREISGQPEYTGHRMLNVLDLLQSMRTLPERSALWESVTSRLFEADYVLMETPVRTYGLTPLHFAPTPISPARGLFSDEVIERHLDDLAARQQEDGGWPIHWSPPAGSATDEWRGRWTLDALVALRAYGRI
jgi:hypothetical protein